MDKITIKTPSTDIRKATADDIKTFLHDAIKMSYTFENGYICNVDYEEKDGKTYVYFLTEYYDYGYYSITWGLEYKLDGVTVTFIGDIFEVKKETVYTPVKPKNSTKMVSDDGSDPFEEDGNIFRSIDKKISDSIQKAFEMFAGKKNKELPIIKQFNDDEMTAIEPMYTLPDVEDGHGEQMDSDTIRKMVDSANKAIKEGRLSGGLFHHENVSEIEIIKAWVNECDCIIGETKVPEGLPIVKVQFHDEELWEMRKNGILKGLSIGAKGERVIIEDE